MSMLPEVSVTSPNSATATTGFDGTQDIAGQEGWSKDTTALPSLPDLSLERRKFRCRILEETLVQSARLSREESLPLKRSSAKEEDICRSVYKKQAHSFFNELKEEFSKEAAALRKQAAKAVVKSGSHDEITSTISELRAQVVALQPGLTLQLAGGEEEAAPTFGAQSRDKVVQERNVLKAWFSTVNERITRQQEEMKTITRQLKGDAAAVKKIARGHIEQMQQEVMHSCLEEVNKLFKDLKDNLTENTMVPVISKVLEKELAPRLHEVQAEISVARAGFSSEARELIQRVDTAITAQTIIDQRIEECEEKQRSGAWALEQLTEELHSQNADLHIRNGSVEVRCDALELRVDTSQRTVESLEINFQRTQTDLDTEQSTRAKANEELTKELAILNKRTEALLEQNEDHCATQKKLLQQLTEAASSLEANQQQVWETFKSQATEVEGKIQSQLQGLRIDVDDLQTRLPPPAVVDSTASKDEAGKLSDSSTAGDEKIAPAAAVSSPTSAKPDQRRPSKSRLKRAQTR